MACEIVEAAARSLGKRSATSISGVTIPVYPDVFSAAIVRPSAERIGTAKAVIP